MALETPTFASLTHAAPRITKTTFIARLKSKNSPAYPFASSLFDIFVAEGVDPCFALAQFRVESQYGTAGHALVSKAWGNSLYDSNLTRRAVDKYSPGNGFTYAVYDNWQDSVRDYCYILHDYAERRDRPSIFYSCWEWIGPGKPIASAQSYTSVVVQDMTDYMFPPGAFFDTGDRMIYGGPPFDRATGRVVQKYPVVKNTTKLYKGPSDDLLLKTYAGTSGDAWFLGTVNGSWTWGVIAIGTSVADEDVTWVFIKNPDKTKVKTLT